ncbi:MAG TPA: hypothetical protein VI981_01620 [Candidatus Paceibacterota bacterium]
MTPEEKSILLKTQELALENNKILRSMQRNSRWSMFFRVIYWTALIVIAGGTYYFLQPYLEQLLKVYGSASNLFD